MKQIFILTSLFLALSISSIGQKQKSGAGDSPENTQVSRSSNKKNSKNSTGETTLSAGTNLVAELQSMIDVRKSNVGDEVILKTTKAIKQNGEVVVPKGASLIGRITEVKRKTKDNATSRVGMVFDRIQGKSLDAPINASIVSIATAQVNAAAGDLFSGDVSGSSSTSGSAGRSSSSGGGLLGGAGSALGGVVNSTTSTAGNIAGTAVNTVGQTTGAVVNTAGSTAGNLGNTVKGLQISQSASGSANSTSTISAQGKDVRIEKGASFQLRTESSVQNQE